jgi:hypothetical protein
VVEMGAVVSGMGCPMSNLTELNSNLNQLPISNIMLHKH